MSTMAYTARHSCGRIVAATIDNPEHRKDVARETARWIRDGDIVEHMTLDQAKAADWCECWREKPPIEVPHV